MWYLLGIFSSDWCAIIHLLFQSWSKMLQKSADTQAHKILCWKQLTRLWKLGRRGVIKVQGKMWIHEWGSGVGSLCPYKDATIKKTTHVDEIIPKSMFTSKNLFWSMDASKLLYQDLSVVYNSTNSPDVKIMLSDIMYCVFYHCFKFINVII